jgi:hypothetical protein
MNSLKLRIPKADLPYFDDYVFRLPERFPPGVFEWVDVELVSELDPATMRHECKLYLFPNHFCRAIEKKLIGGCSVADSAFVSEQDKSAIVRHMINYAMRGYRASLEAKSP